MPLNPETGGNASAIAAGKAHTCVVFLQGTIMCWGLNQDGQLGIESSSNKLSPTSVNLGSGF